MARVANIPYCMRDSNSIGHVVPGVIAHAYKVSQTGEIIVYFKGLDLTPRQWKKRKSFVGVYKHDNLRRIMPMSSVAPVLDQAWLGEIKTMKPLLLDEIEKLARPPSTNGHGRRQLLLTGHGIGGVYAILASLELTLESFQPNSFLKDMQIITTTFGQPRLGLAQFANLINALNIKISRITHANDYLPREHLERAGTMGFQHHETEFWINYPDCGCPDPNNPYNFEVWACTGFLDENVNGNKNYILTGHGENPNCNLGQENTTGMDPEAAHMGPYFGITFGVCNTESMEVLNAQFSAN
ncbi:hypothetical protein G9A89_012861 [Geosiphon pyriformis]|nr:hypothetical protein G9A89_012861 [Geosiphon pyriformis]